MVSEYNNGDLGSTVPNSSPYLRMGNANSELEGHEALHAAIKKSESRDGTKLNIADSREIEFSPTENSTRQSSEHISNDNLQTNKEIEKSNDSVNGREAPLNPAVLKLQKKSRNASNDSLRGNRHMQRVQSNASINESFLSSVNKLNISKGASTENIKVSEKSKSHYSSKLEVSRIAMLKKYRMSKFNSTSCLFVDFVLVNSDTNQYLK